MDPRAVIFDLDGTLLDTIEDLADSANAALLRLGAPPHPVAAYRIFVGDGVTALLARALPPDRRDEATVRRGVAAMREEYARRMRSKTRPYEGVPELLSRLAGRGVPLAVLSNKMDDATRLLVAHYFSAIPFVEVRGVREGGVRKPDPAGALEIAKAFALPPAAVLYLGDTNTDMETARRAGMEPIGVLWGFRDAAELQAAGARRLLTRPAELLAYFRNTTEA